MEDGIACKSSADAVTPEVDVWMSEGKKVNNLVGFTILKIRTEYIFVDILSRFGRGHFHLSEFFFLNVLQRFSAIRRQKF